MTAAARTAALLAVTPVPVTGQTLSDPARGTCSLCLFAKSSLRAEIRTARENTSTEVVFAPHGHRRNIVNTHTDLLAKAC